MISFPLPSSSQTTSFFFIQTSSRAVSLLFRTGMVGLVVGFLFFFPPVRQHFHRLKESWKFGIAHSRRARTFYGPCLELDFRVCRICATRENVVLAINELDNHS